MTKIERPAGPLCPVCGGPVRRVRRTRADRIVSRVRSVRRYSCHDRMCRWEGLLRDRGGHELRYPPWWIWILILLLTVAAGISLALYLNPGPPPSFYDLEP